jgi:AraC family transcriptional regulator
MTHRQTYIARINRVVDHIDAHLAEPLDLQRLASVAHFSPWHFHRIFQALTGETLADRVRRRRLEVAAGRLLATPPAPALNIALDVGFASPEVFTRAFRNHFGVTPSAWRRGAFRDWAERHRAQLSKIHQADRKARQVIADGFHDDVQAWPVGQAAQLQGAMMDVEFKTLPATRVAYMRHVGPYGDSGISRLWQRFGAWCGQNRLVPPPKVMYGISHDNPDVTAPDKCRYDACIGVDNSFQPQGEVGVQALPGGRYACVEFSGTPDAIHAAWMKLFAGWLPDSGYQVDDRPCIELYGEDFAVDPKTGGFSCLLCLPVRAM